MRVVASGPSAWRGTGRLLPIIEVGGVLPCVDLHIRAWTEYEQLFSVRLPVYEYFHIVLYEYA